MRRLIFPLVLGFGGAAILLALGVWQIDRLGQKQAYLAQIEARIGDRPQALPAAPDAQADRFLPVETSGRFLPGEVLVLSGVKGVGPGYRVIAPFETDDGRRVLIDRGFVPEVDRAAVRPAGAARITGNLHWPDETDSFTPAPDAAAGLWFARDVAAMSEAFGTEQVLIVLRETSETGTGLVPQPVNTSGVPNDHLGYAITWFGLALVWLGMTAFLIRRITRPTQ